MGVGRDRKGGSTAEARRALARVGLSVDVNDGAGPPAGAAPGAYDARGPRPRGSSERLVRAAGANLAAVHDGGRSTQTVALYRAALARFVRWLDGERPGARR